MLRYSSGIMNVTNNFIVLHACLQCYQVIHCYQASYLRFARDFDKLHLTMIGYAIKFKLLLRRQRS